MNPWLFFVWAVKWLAAVFGTITCGVAIVLFLVALVSEIRDVLL